MAAGTTTPPSPATTILLRGELARVQLEGRVGTGLSIIPGMLVEQLTTVDSPYCDYKPHATAGGVGEKIVALESRFFADIPFGATFHGGTIDDAYAEGKLMFLHLCQPGDELYMFLPASAAAVTLADYLCSNGDGTLKKWTDGNPDPLFKPLEAKNNSGGSGRIRIRARAM